MVADAKRLEPGADSKYLDGELIAHARALFVILAVIFVAYFGTFRSLAGVWLNTGTFLHGIIIFPISSYLVWRKWPVLRQIRTKPFRPGVLVLILLALIWLASDFLGIQVGTHFAVVAIIPVTVMTVMGLQFSRNIAFPLGYLIFAVPFGEALVPYLIEYTATFTVKALNITGIPVIRDGRYFSLPVGNFEVAEACSGIRYLLATLALGTLFGYFSFLSTWKRTIFLICSIVLPIIANGFRAYGIVLLAYYSDMKIAIGFDHIIYGWVFFGFVIAILFLLGSRFQDAEAEIVTSDRGYVKTSSAEVKASSRALLLIVPLVLVSSLAGPALQIVFETTGKGSLSSFAMLPSDIDGWSVSNSYDAKYKPRYSGASRQLFAQYDTNDSQVNLAVIQYLDSHQGAELANSENSVVDASLGWDLENVRYLAITLPTQGTFGVREVVARRPGSLALIWYWHSVNGQPAESDIGIKLREARALLSGQESISTATIVVTPVDVDMATSRSALRSFVSASYVPIKRCLASAEQQSECKHGATKLVMH